MEVFCTSDAASVGVIELSSLSIQEESAIGSVVGALLVSGGSGSYTFSITADPDNKFTIVGDELRIDQLLDYSADSSHAVNVQADNGVDTPSTVEFVITVLENAAPTIENLFPIDGATDAVIDTDLIVTFNKAVQPGTGLISVYNASGDVLIESFNVATEAGTSAGQVEFSSDTVTLRMTSDFSAGVNVYVQVASTAVQNVSGAAFAGIADETTWNFLTVATPPVVANQTLSFGRLTRANAGRAGVVNTGTPITSATINSGDASNHWDVNSSGEFYPTSTGSTAALSGAPYTLGCTFANAGGSDTATITINAEDNVYSVVPDPGVAGSAAAQAEVDAALSHLKTNGDGGKTVKYRPGRERFYHNYNKIGYLGGSPRNFANQVIVTSHDVDDQVEFIPWAITTTTIIRSWKNIKAYRVKFHAINDGSIPLASYAAPNSGFAIHSPDNTIFEECEFFGDNTDFTYAEIELGYTGTAGGKVLHQFLMQNQHTGAITGLYHLKNCDFHGGCRLLSLPDTYSTTPAGHVIVEGCNFYDFTLDALTIHVTANLDVAFCNFYAPYTFGGDPGHGDCVQRSNSDAGDDEGIRIFGCRALFKREVEIPDTKECFQLLFLQTGLLGSSIKHQYNTRIIGNLLFTGPTTATTYGSPGANKAAVQGIWSDHVGMEDSYIIANTIVCQATADANNQPYIYLAGGSNNVITRNAIHSVTGTGSSVTNAYNNQQVRSHTTGLPTTYDTLFTGIAGDFVPATLTELETMFAPKGGAALVTNGIGAHFVDRTNRILDVPELNVAAWTAHADITGATTSTLTTAAAGRQVTVTRDISWATGSPSAVSVYGAAVYVTAASGSPQWKSSSDSGGSVPVTDWTTARGVIATGHYLWVRVTSSGSAATAVSVTITVGANSDTWTVTTA